MQKARKQVCVFAWNQNKAKEDGVFLTYYEAQQLFLSFLKENEDAKEVHFQKKDDADADKDSLTRGSTRHHQIPPENCTSLEQVHTERGGVAKQYFNIIFFSRYFKMD